MGTIANINGANVTRLRVLQMGSNNTSCVLSNALIEDGDTNKYVCSVENLVVSTDIPIFEKGTTVFIIYEVHNEDQLGGNLNFDDLEELPSFYKCVVGPVYSFLDFVSQIQKFCDRYNRFSSAAVDETAGIIGVDSQLASKKQFGLHGDRDFWKKHVIYFPNEMGRIFDGLNGDEGFYHMYLQSAGSAILANLPKNDLWELHNGTIRWKEDPADYLYLEEDWNLGASVTLSVKCKMDIFEKRVGLIVDAVLPIPLQMFCVNANKGENRKAASKYAFLTLDFPEGRLTHKTIITGSRISDDMEISQPLRTGVFRILGDSRNSVAKKLIPGQLQDHRYELLLIRKETNSDGSVTLKEEKLMFGIGDYWKMDVVFTKQV